MTIIKYNQEDMPFEKYISKEQLSEFFLYKGIKLNSMFWDFKMEYSENDIYGDDYILSFRSKYDDTTDYGTFKISEFELLINARMDFMMAREITKEDINLAYQKYMISIKGDEYFHRLMSFYGAKLDELRSSQEVEQKDLNYEDQIQRKSLITRILDESKNLKIAKLEEEIREIGTYYALLMSQKKTNKKASSNRKNKKSQSVEC